MLTPGAATSGLMSSRFAGPRLEKPARKSSLAVNTSIGDVPAIAIGSPATLLTTSTPEAPAAAALATLVAKVQVPRSRTTMRPAKGVPPRAAHAEVAPAASAGLLQLASGAVTEGLKELNWPTAAPNVLEPTRTGMPKKWLLVTAAAVIARAAWPGLSTVFTPGPEFPAAIATTTPASAARLLATVSSSWKPLMPPP